VNRAEVEAFRRRARDLLDRYEDALREIEKDEARRLGVTIEETAGTGREITLEAQTRLYVLDPLLQEIGWEVQAAAAIVVEDNVEPAQDDADAHRRRLDYHGRDNNAARSLLAIEVKRPKVRLPRTGNKSVEDWIADALRKVSVGGAAAETVPAEWRKILASSVDYVKRIMAAYGGAPVRFVLTNGEWFLVFSDLSATILARDPEAGKIVLFSDLSEVIARADEFCTLLAYQDLSGHIPPQHPGDLPDFVPEGEVATCSRFVDVSYTRHGERQPLISASVGVWIRTPKGAWILFQKNYDNQFLVLSDDRDELTTRRQQLNARAENLLAELRNHRELRFASREEFEGGTHRGDPNGLIPAAGAERASTLMREIGRDRYRIATTEQLLFFTDDGTYDGCSYHNWGSCRAEGNAVGESAITAPSSDPRCFFPSGSPYHCAHAAIQARRKHVCLLLAFEEHLCCRRCVFLSRCWPDTAAMPCRLD
jgi:hypothetical protein